MRIIVSPAKQMSCSEAALPAQGEGALISRAEQVLAALQALPREQAQRLWGCSDKLAASAFGATQAAQLRSAAAAPAILAYDGIAYKYMVPQAFTYDEFDYVQEHLRILSGLYGCLRPMDGIVEHRLEMQHKLQVGGAKNLYEFWGSAIYDEVMRSNSNRIVVNLASKEYSRCIERYLQPQDTFVTCTFAQDTGGKLTQKGVWCKMARGEMVRYMAVHDISSVEDLAGFDSPDWEFSEALSTEAELVFLHRDAGPAHYMYVVRCCDGSLYTGYTTDVERRVAQHNAGTGAKYTRTHRPVQLVDAAKFSTKHDAMRAEFKFKQLPRNEKDALLSLSAQGTPLQFVLRQHLL